MAKHKYLIDINDPENWLNVNYHEDADGNVDEEQRIIIYPEGGNQRFDFTDSIFYGQTSYHEHNFGWEIFFMTQGTMDFTVHGKTATVHSGDVLVVSPWCSHQMVFLEPTRWRATFHDMGMSNTLDTWGHVQTYYPGWRNDPQMTRTYLANRNNILREPAFSTRVEKSELYEVRNANHYLNRYDFEGVTMKQMTARWEQNGVLEMWRLEMGNSFAVQYQPVVPNPDLFYITEGEVEFTVGGETFTAHQDCLVKIPSFVPRSFISRGKSVMYDIGGITHWLDVIEDWQSLKFNNSEKYQDKAYVQEVLHRHDCYVQSFGIMR